VRNGAGSGRDERTRARLRTPALFVVVALIATADQITKTWAVRALDRPLHVIGPIDLELSRNPGGAFSTFTRATPVLAILAIALAVVLVRAARRATDPVMAYVLATVLGGATGNLIDRVARAPGFLRGEVIDFVKVGWWPTFNVADAAVSVGAVVLVLWGWRR
jgi:signal peptidase II